MKIAPACFNSDQGDVLMSSLPEPEQPSTIAKWTPKDQVEWNRITDNNSGEGSKYSPFSVRTTKIKIISAGCGGDSIDLPVTEEDLEEQPIDHDGDGYYQNGGDVLDCYDRNANVHPGAEEVCDGWDNNCDGEIDENCNGNADQNSEPEPEHPYSRENADQDGDGFSLSQGDCKDANPAINPDATEITGNTVDENCNGREDADQDGDGITREGGDCKDADPAINPSTPEITGNDVDENCNEMGDADQDGDGITLDQGDCDDTNSAANQNAQEITGNAIDENCNEMGDADQDGDGFSLNQGDHNDRDPTINPDATEITGNTVDENSNGMGDADQDGDGITLDQGDCVDTNSAAHPGAQEIQGNSVDENCNGNVDALGPECDISVGCSFSRGFGIQDTIDSIVDGGTICLCEGVYNEYLQIYKNVSLVGASPATTILKNDPQISSEFINSSNYNIVIKNITFDGNIDEQGFSNAGGLWFQQGSAPTPGVQVEIDNCRFIRNSLTHAGAIYANSINLVIRDSTFEQNPPGMNGFGIGAGLYFQGRGSLVISNTDFFNTDTWGMHVLAIESPNYILSGTRVYSTNSTGDIVTLLGNGIIENSEFYLNSSSDTIIFGNGSLTLRNSSIHNNTGLGVYVGIDGVLHSINTTWSQNNPHDIGYGACYAPEGCGDTYRINPGEASYFDADGETTFTCTSSGCE